MQRAFLKIFPRDEARETSLKDNLLVVSLSRAPTLPISLLLLPFARDFFLELHCKPRRPWKIVSEEIEAVSRENPFFFFFFFFFFSPPLFYSFPLATPRLTVTIQPCHSSTRISPSPPRDRTSMAGGNLSLLAPSFTNSHVTQESKISILGEKRSNFSAARRKEA